MTMTAAKPFVLLCICFTIVNHACSLPFSKRVREGRAATSTGVTDEEADVTFLNRAFLLSKSSASGFVRSAGGIHRLGADLTTVAASVPPSLEGVHPEGMILSEDERTLIVLWTNGSSFVYDSTTLVPVRELWGGFGHYWPQTRRLHGAPLQVVYSGEGDDSVYILSGSEYIDVAQVAMNGSTLKKESKYINKNSFWRELKYGFSHGNYSYVVSSDCNAHYEVRIARFCSSPNARAFNSWYELQLTCGRRTSATSYSHSLLNATLLKTPTTSNASPLLVITVRVDQREETRVCSYSLDDINQMMDDTFETCKTTGGSYGLVWEPNWETGHCRKTDVDLQGITPCSLSTETIPGLTQGPMQLASRNPLNQDPPLLTLHGATPSTTMAAFRGGDSVVICVGTRNGTVREYKAGSDDIQQEWIISEDTAVVHLTMAEDGSVLYALLNNSVPTIFSVPLSNHTHAITDGATSDDALPPPTRVYEIIHEQALADRESLTKTLQKLESLQMNSKIRRFLSRLAHLLHTYGQDEQLNNSTETARKGGVWRVTQSMFRATQNKSSRQYLSTMKKRIQRKFNITWSAVAYTDLDDPLHSSLAVVLYLQTLEKGLLRGPRKQAEIWAAHFAAKVFGEECHDCAAKRFLCVLCKVDKVCVKKLKDCQ